MSPGAEWVLHCRPCYHRGMVLEANSWLLLQQAGEQDGDVAVAARADEELEPERLLLCRACLAEITSSRRAVVRDGSHRHTFANPHGLLFEIGLFSSAPGCLAAGTPTDEFTWFSGFFWRHALCAGCATHLGWHFERGAECFWGLVLKRLVEQ